MSGEDYLYTNFYPKGQNAYTSLITATSGYVRTKIDNDYKIVWDSDIVSHEGGKATALLTWPRIYATTRMTCADGKESEPSLTFASAGTATGLHSDNTPAIYMSLNGTNTFAISSALGVCASNQFACQYGNASAPSHTFISNLNTGMYRSDTNKIGFSSNGNKVVEIDPNGLLCYPNFGFIGDVTSGWRSNLAGSFDLQSLGTPIAGVFDQGFYTRDGDKFEIRNSSDATKKIKFSGANITTGNSRTITIPDASGEMAYVSTKTNNYMPIYNSTTKAFDTNSETAIVKNTASQLAMRLNSTDNIIYFNYSSPQIQCTSIRANNSYWHDGYEVKFDSLAGTDDFAYKAHTQTLSNKTVTAIKNTLTIITTTPYTISDLTTGNNYGVLYSGTATVNLPSIGTIGAGRNLFFHENANYTAILTPNGSEKIGPREFTSIKLYAHADSVLLCSTGSKWGLFDGRKQLQGVYYKQEAFNTTLTNQDEWYIINNQATVGTEHLISRSNGSYTVTPISAEVEITLMAKVAITVPSADIQICVFVNATQQDSFTVIKNTVSAECCAFCATCSVVANDVITIKAKCTSDAGKVITFSNYSLRIKSNYIQ